MKPEFGSLVTAMSDAALDYVASGSSIELARNIAQTLWMLHSSGAEYDAGEIATEAIRHRVDHDWLRVSDMHAAAAAIETAWKAWLRGQSAPPAERTAIERALAAGHALKVQRFARACVVEARCAACSALGETLREALDALEIEVAKEQER